MIGYISGKVIDIDIKTLIILTGAEAFQAGASGTTWAGVAGSAGGGVGYKLFATQAVLSKAEINQPLSVFVYTAVKEDAIDLYAFETKDSLYFFNLLLGISGVGPKSALNIINLVTLETLEEAILDEDASYLTKISGLGKKLADKIIVELKGKILPRQERNLGKEDRVSNSKSKAGKELEVLEALKALGYTQRESKEALDKLSKEDKLLSVNEIIKACLRQLS